MAIEDLKTKADLQRFIQDQLQGLPTSTIQGLAEALAADSAEQEIATEDKEPGEAFELIPGCSYKAPANMTGLVIAHADISGSGIAKLFVRGEGVNPQINQFSGSRISCTTSIPVVLAKDDVVELRGREWLEPVTFVETHTALTIVRLT